MFEPTHTHDDAATPQTQTPPQHNLRRSSCSRKALFPADGETGSESDLGLISSNGEALNEIFTFFKKRGNVNEYIFDGSESRNLVTPSPLLYSPQQSFSLLTPLSKSPTSKLKTPHDTSTVKVNSKQPKKKLQDLVLQSEVAVNKSKVRTALFPENEVSEGISVKNFYPKDVGSIERRVVKVAAEAPKRFRTSTVANRRKAFGRINNGVRHKIKKPKKKKAAKEKIFKAAQNILENNKIDEYLEEMALVKRISRKPKDLDAKKDEPVKIETKKRKFGEEFSANIENIIANLDAELDTENLILSPTSQMCDMASGLAIRSPKRARLNINHLLGPSAAEMKKLFPIFTEPTSARKPPPKKVAAKRWSKPDENQMFLDVGQKKFGLLECAECGMMFHQGDPGDEEGHWRYHNAVDTLKFPGWRNERVVLEPPTGRIIKIQPGDSKAWWKKANDVLEIVNRDLGHPDSTAQNSQIYLFIKNKQIAGCLTADVQTSAYKMLQPIDGLDLCSEDSYPIKCGVSRLWVSPVYRKCGVATALMEALRRNFLPGYILSNADIALSSPTAHGKAFAAKYFKTENFLIYM